MGVHSQDYRNHVGPSSDLIRKLPPVELVVRGERKWLTDWLTDRWKLSFERFRFPLSPQGSDRAQES